jgi:YbbR domain-containing protein
MDNVGTVLLSLLLALFVWVASVQENNPTVRGVFSEQIAIEVKNKPVGLEFLDPTVADQKVQLVIAAPQSSWENLRASSFQAWIDLQGLSADMHEVDIQVKCSDRQVRIESKQPSKLSIRLEPLKEKRVDVRVRIPDDPAQGYMARAPQVTPATVTVTGPASTVDRVD